MPNTTARISWLAGLLEGEGCFSVRGRGHNPTVQLVMTDADVVVSAARLMGAHRVVRCKRDTRAKNPKPLFRVNVYGQRAIEWMMTIYALMGERRRGQIRACMVAWKERTSRAKNYPRERRPASRGAPVIWARCEGV